MKPVHLPLSLAMAAVLSVAGRADAQTITFSPRVAVTETFTDNVGLSNTTKQSEQITAISPGIQLAVNGGRLNATLDYSLTHVAYTQSTSADRNQNALNASGHYEAIEGWAFIDFSGIISQQTISAFGTQSTSATAIDANQTEVSTYRVSPYIKGHVGNAFNYEARVNRNISSSDGNAASNTASTESSFRAYNASAFRKLGWSADLSRQRSDYSAGRTTESDIASLGLTYEIDSHLNLSANAGRESSNYTSLTKDSFATSSVGLNWILSDRTKLLVLRGNRSFGSTHNVTFEHRSARTVWQFSDVRDVSTTPGQNGVGSIGNAYDLFFAQFQAIEPNPIARAQLVNNFLQSNGIDRNATVIGNFLTSAVALQRRQNLSFALLGLRDTVTFLFSRTASNRLDVLSSSIDNLSTSSQVRQQGFSVNLAHRLTPDYSLSMMLSRQNTSGDTAAQENTLKSLNINVSGTVGKRTTAGLGLRRVLSDSPTSPYAETALIGNLNVRF